MSGKGNLFEFFFLFKRYLTVAYPEAAVLFYPVSDRFFGHSHVFRKISDHRFSVLLDAGEGGFQGFDAFLLLLLLGLFVAEILLEGGVFGVALAVEITVREDAAAVRQVYRVAVPEVERLEARELAQRAFYAPCTALSDG